MLEPILERAADIAWAIAFFAFLGLGLAAYERGVRRSEEARREHAAEVERASRAAYAEAKRVRKDVWA